ncbi:hypothetical protein [Pectobacterium carotovorum]|uniref:hypothetical protein n=1 Tax=Pectobacterium carotovorum TaxID=554 RepID=UPI0021C32911|nr:hypothetical protein [Pectobacterium carotovorum]EKG1878189.1 hypothetical protein [Salmonella enterica]GKW07838.1 hypothetical protein PEC301889_23210 [Pectobacterium carotovorum subsp. carotovorum]
MSSRYCVYSLLVPNSTLLNYLDSESVKSSKLLPNENTEIYFIFDLEKGISLPFSFTDSHAALSRCNSENKDHGSSEFDYVNYEIASNKTIVIENTNYQFSSNSEQHYILSNTITSNSYGVTHIVEELKEYAAKQFSNGIITRSKYEC